MKLHYRDTDNTWKDLVVPIANGGTGSTTAADAWKALGGGTVGKLNTNTSTTTYLRNDGQWVTPPNTTYGIVTSNVDGLAPRVTDTTAFLKGNCTWSAISNYKVTATLNSTNTSYYPLLKDMSVNGDVEGETFVSSKLKVNPSTGTITTPAITASSEIINNSNTVRSSQILFHIGFPADRANLTNYANFNVGTKGEVLVTPWPNLNSSNQQLTYSPVYCSATYTSSSEKLKQNIQNISVDESEKIYDLRPVNFDYIDGDNNRVGLIAEEVKEVYPDIVSKLPVNDNNIESLSLKEDQNEGVLYGMDYANFVPYLIKAMQKQNNKLEKIEQDIQILKKEI